MFVVANCLVCAGVHYVPQIHLRVGCLGIRRHFVGNV